MKKVLLIIAIIFLMFQIVVLAIGIEIGAGATDRSTYWNPNITTVDKNVAATDTGKITSIEIWAQAAHDLENCEIGIFYVVSGDNLATRSTVLLGTVTSGSKQTFTEDSESNPISMDVVAGDHIGYCCTSGWLERDNTGVGVWYISGDSIPCESTLFTFSSNKTVSLYGTGATIPEIDIGNSASDRGDYATLGTMVDKFNPANLSGTITSVEIYTYWQTDMLDCEVATFFIVSGNNLSTRDSEVIGTVTKGGKRTFEVNLDVEAGDVIGIYFSAGAIEYDTSGGIGIWYKTGDNIPCTDVTFTYGAGPTFSLYGTGVAEEEEEEENAIFFGTNF